MYPSPPGSCSLHAFTLLGLKTLAHFEQRPPMHLSRPVANRRFPIIWNDVYSKRHCRFPRLSPRKPLLENQALGGYSRTTPEPCSAYGLPPSTDGSRLAYTDRFCRWDGVGEISGYLMAQRRRQVRNRCINNGAITMPNRMTDGRRSRGTVSACSPSSRRSPSPAWCMRR